MYSRALTVVLAAGMCGVASAQCQDVYRPDLPDLDQRRAEAPGILGLEWNGASHCVPSSWANNLVYISDHGLPALMLNQTYDWQDPSSYNIAGALIGYMGFLMGVDQGGAGNSIDGIQALLNERAPGALVGGGAKWTGSPKSMREVLLAGGFAAVTRGFYHTQPNTYQWVRYGGHIITLRGVHDVCTSQPIISVRDPNTSTATESLFAQSMFSTRYDRMEKQNLPMYIDGSIEDRDMWRFTDFVGVNPSNGWTACRLMDGYATLMPTVALKGKPVVGEDPSGIDFVRPLNLTDSVRPTHNGGTMPAGTGTIRAVHIDPSLAYAWVLADGPGGGTRLLSVGMGSGTVEMKYELENTIITSFISHEGEVYAATGADLFRLAPDPQSGMWQTKEHVLLATPVVAMDQDDSAGEIVMILQGSAGPTICRRPLELAAPQGPQQPCPPGVVFSGPVEIAVHPQTGQVLCSSPGVPAVYRLAMDAAGGWQLGETIALPAGAQPSCPTWTDTGSLLFVNNGVVEELEPTAGAGWQPKTGSYFAGTSVPPGQVFTLATTRPAAEPPLPLQIPDDILPDQPDVCSADFDGDGDIGTDADIEAFFACLAGDCCIRCNSADYNGDGDVGTDADIEAFFRVLAGGAC